MHRSDLYLLFQQHSFNWTNALRIVFDFFYVILQNPRDISIRNNKQRTADLNANFAILFLADCNMHN